MNKAFLVFLALCILLVFNTVCVAKPANPAKPGWFIGAWHGYSDDGELEFVRLELGNGGAGVMALSELPDTSADLYRIHWQQSSVGSYQLSIHAKAADSTAEKITLRNVYYDGFVLSFQLDGQGWSRHFILFNEKDFAQRATAARQALKKLR